MLRYPEQVGLAGERQRFSNQFVVLDRLRALKEASG